MFRNGLLYGNTNLGQLTNTGFFGFEFLGCRKRFNVLGHRFELTGLIDFDYFNSNDTFSVFRGDFNFTLQVFLLHTNKLISFQA